MSKAVTVTFAPEGIQEIQLYVTSKWAKKTASQVRKLTGADVVINASLFLTSGWKPCCCVKANGKVLRNDGYAYRGLAWNNGDDHFTEALSPEMWKWDNFLSCVMLYHEGKALPLSCTPDVARSAGRTAVIGTKDGAVHLWCVAEGKANQTPWELQKTVKTKYPTVVWALMLDGGGSVQLSQEGKDYIYSSRRVQNYLCFWRRDIEPRGAKPMGIHCQSYSVKKQGKLYLSKHFQAKEFACRDSSDTVWVAEELLDVLESIRAQAGGKPMTVLSGYRTPSYNTKVGGAEYSQHVYGTAADICVKGVDVNTLAKYARIAMPERGGVGIYVKQGFCHVDVREARADWTG